MSDYPGTQLVDHEFELRPGLVVRLVLPRNLTRSDADRLRAFYEALTHA